MEDSTLISETADDNVQPQDEISLQDTLRDTLRNIEGAEETSSENLPALEEQAPQNDSDKESTVSAPTEVLPNSWKKEAADAWAKADPILRSEVQRREADFHKGIEQYREAAEFARAMGEAVAPYYKTISELGYTPQQAFKVMMDADAKLRYSSPDEKAMHLAQLGKSYGIDLNKVVELSQTVDPRLYELRQQNEMLKQQFHQTQQQAQQQTENELNSHISVFAADPSHPHFEAVKLDMAALLQAGRANNLQDAYEKAIYANPEVRDAVLKQQAKTAKEEASKKAQAAKAAARVNIRSTPSMPTTLENTGDIKDTLREVYRRASNQI